MKNSPHFLGYVALTSVVVFFAIAGIASANDRSSHSTNTPTDKPKPDLPPIVCDSFFDIVYPIIDTVVRREAPPASPQDKIPIELVQLQLHSICPIEVFDPDGPHDGDGGDGEENDGIIHFGAL